MTEETTPTFTAKAVEFIGKIMVQVERDGKVHQRIAVDFVIPESMFEEKTLMDMAAEAASMVRQKL